MEEQTAEEAKMPTDEQEEKPEGNQSVAEKRANKLPDKQRFAAIIALSVSSGFLVFFLTPFDIFLYNPTDFIVSWSFLFAPLFVFALASSLGLIGVFCILMYRKIIFAVGLHVVYAAYVTYVWLEHGFYPRSYFWVMLAIFGFLGLWIAFDKIFKEKFIDIALLVGMGMLISAQIQVLFLNGNLGEITGQGQNYNFKIIIYSSIMFAITTFSPLTIWLLLKRKKNKIRYEKMVIFVAILVFGMQLSGLISAAVSAELPEGYDEGETEYLSYEALLDLSGEDNIIVFITDRLDGVYMEWVLREYPEMYELLDGFTYYSNYVAEFQKTFPAVATMLTGHYYDYGAGLTFTEYWNEAWAQRTPIDILREHGYSTNLYLDRISTYNHIDQIRDKADNIAYANNVELHIHNMISTVGRISFGRLSPYFMKDLYLMSIDSSLANSMFYVDIDDYPDYSRPVVGFESDLDFYHYIKDNEVTAKSEKKVFSFIHLNASHGGEGYRYSAQNDEIVDWGGAVLETTRAAFEIINTYMEKMKELGVYDNSTIIILSDHSAYELSTAVLFIKPKNSRGIMQEDSKTQLSGKYFPASLLDAAGIERASGGRGTDGGFGISFFDIIEGKVTPPPRYLYVQSDWWWARWDTENVTLVETWLVPDDASDIKSWYRIGD
ncbi:MAG: sulfatase-like hydrolase/transferase [Oscillospiraceae bacterium]|nr:sulfatase-like hydrolase/transferase [Oscillospiraceae bacterium]